MANPASKKGPRFVAFIGPTLDALRALGASAKPAEVFEWIAKGLQLSNSELEATNKNGRSKFENQVAWARFYLTKADLIDPDQRGVWVLTEKGRRTTLTHDEAYELFRSVHFDFSQPRPEGPQVVSEGQAPEDTSAPGDDTYLNEGSVRQRLAGSIGNLSSGGFEKFCALMMRHIGFESVKVTGRSRDRGVDGEGILLLNRFVRSRVMFQCKHYRENNVGPEKVRDFRGAIQGRAERGILFTTGVFTSEAKQEAARENAVPIELVDLERLIDLMIEEKLGVAEVRALKLDDHFFNVFEVAE